MEHLILHDAQAVWRISIWRLTAQIQINGFVSEEKNKTRHLPVRDVDNKNTFVLIRIHPHWNNHSPSAPISSNMTHYLFFLKLCKLCDQCKMIENDRKACLRYAQPQQLAGRVSPLTHSFIPHPPSRLFCSKKADIQAFHV